VPPAGPSADLRPLERSPSSGRSRGRRGGSRPGAGLAEIGFTLAPQHQGYGYATEAVRRLLHYLLIEQGKHRVRASCDDRNTRSAAVLERVGMRREGHLLESTWSKGEWTNDLLYGVLRREWPSGS